MGDFFKCVAVAFFVLFALALVLITIAVRIAIVVLIIWCLVLGVQKLSADEPMPMAPEITIDAEVARWQMSKEWVERCYLSAKRYRDDVPVIAALNRSIPESMLIADAQYRFAVWNELDNVVRLRMPVASERLREYIGDEAWHFRIIPTPTPWGYE